MAMGGGTWTTQNKVLAGAYINVASLQSATAMLSERGIVALPMAFNYAPDGVFTIDKEIMSSKEKCTKLLGYLPTNSSFTPINDILQNAQTIYAYNITGGDGATAASNDYATCVYKGKDGNKFNIKISVNADDTDKFDVQTLWGANVRDEQTKVADASELTNNGYVVWKTDATLAAGTYTMTGGTNSTNTNNDGMLNALDAFEEYSFNILVCPASDDDTKTTFINYVKRHRDELGRKFQVVGHQMPTADYIGVISLDNEGDSQPNGAVNGAVYWLAGAEAGCAVNKSLINKKYTGSYTQTTSYTQQELIDAIANGKLVFHKNGTDICILDDINTFTSYTDSMNEDFASNQTIRVLDQIANDDAYVFNTKYVGKIPNDNAGRISLWNDLAALRQELQAMRAIENFETADLTVEAGEKRYAVLVTGYIQPVNAMKIMYENAFVE